MANDQLQDLIDGMTQDERRIKALDPDYIKIDGRTVEELLKFMTDLAGEINFYNEKNQVDGTWQDFFKSDINILIMLITRFDLTRHMAQFERLESKIQTSTGDKEALSALRELFSYLSDIINTFKVSHEKLKSGPAYNRIASELSGIIAAFGPEINLINAYTQEAGDLFGESFRINIAGDDFEKTEDEPGPIFGADPEIKQKILPALPEIKKAFTSLRTKYNNFLGVTAFYYKDHDISGQEYPPHLALCITFLHLFQNLQNQLNDVSREHLNFYYKDVLGLQPRSAVPDSVHIVFDPAVVDRVDLEEGEELQAEVDGRTLYYLLNEDLMVTKAKVTELRTVFLDEHTQVVSPEIEDKDVNETEVYKASYPNLQPGEFFKSQSLLKPWPVLGESQFELSDDDRTMEDAEIGLLLASPVLYLTEGTRTVSILFYFETGSFIQLLQYFRNFAKITGKLLQTVSYELLSDAFVLSFTTAESWEEIRRYTVKINMAENSIEIEFELSPVDVAFGVYNPEFHGEDYKVEWPIIKVLLNNYSTHNPFSFFRKMIIERVTINSHVNGSRAVKLQNNVGNLSPDNPFHPFGPQPSVGSYLDIKNTNIFNRFTKDFCIKLDWIDLPRNSGGWEDYYKEYNANINNDSFRVKLSALSHGKFKPALSKRQEFNLFNVERGEFGGEILSDSSEISGVDLKKLEMPNRPLLNREALIADQNFTEGAVRLEFSSPKEAFGSKIYPPLLSETVMHNSKRFVTKRPMPNTPAAPVVRSITIDYSLEHSEILLKTFNNEDSALKIIHQYPFGFDNIYPESDKQPYLFIPDFEYENNLYIGIQDLLPEQDLTLLFQLREQNFTNTAKDPAPIIWSYMYNNSWIDFAKGDILYDTTNNFINTGIVKIRLPEDVRKNNTRLSADLHWLRAASKGQTNVMSRMIGVYPHAVTAARLVNDGRDLTAFKLPPNTIKTLSKKIAGLNGLYQLFPSYGGTAAETSEQFYIRVSERLRHKSRLITNRDIEQAILERFPAILMAKCISPEPPLNSIYSAGSRKIRIIVVPEDHEQSYFKNDQPKVSLAVLYQIKTFVKASISTFVDVEIENPVYEKVKIVSKIKFKHNKTSDDGVYKQKLGEDLKKYLCPWLYESSSSFKIGSQIFVTEILNYIKKRPYVDYVTGFSVLHFYNWENEETGEILSGVNDFGRNNLNAIRGSVPEAVIIPSEDHLFEMIAEPEYSDPLRTGVGNLLIGEELLVFDDKLAQNEQAQADKTSIDEDEYFNFFISHDII
ncbi:hypothetical protein [Daejeonella sp. JGW-45]|uniref:hypothetical protein n=1 Tax=Daejeonella sp. JGW-45 TaxID=3034148 RepID=UPI0023EDFEBB|nr:hypothetical protein [Daejeonella sp. JGW-45]